jgi:hypothetical protein
VAVGAIGKVGFKLIGVAFAIPSGIIANKALHKAWVKSRGHQPPADSDRKSVDTDWLEAIVWAAASAAVTAAVQVAATHGAAATYRALTGQHPPTKNAEEAA